MPDGKPAGVRCIQLDESNLCRIFGQPERPLVCAGFKAEAAICGDNDQAAMANLIALEDVTL
jgi:hypothetical protein